MFVVRGREEGGGEESTTWEQHRCDNRIAVGFAVIEGSEAKESSMSEPRISGWRRWRWIIDTFLVVAGAEGCASRQFMHFIRYLVWRSARFRACFCDSCMKWIWSAIAARRRAFARLQLRFLLQNLRLHVLASRKSTKARFSISNFEGGRVNEQRRDNNFWAASSWQCSSQGTTEPSDSIAFNGK